MKMTHKNQHEGTLKLDVHCVDFDQTLVLSVKMVTAVILRWSRCQTPLEQ